MHQRQFYTQTHTQNLTHTNLTKKNIQILHRHPYISYTDTYKNLTQTRIKILHIHTYKSYTYIHTILHRHTYKSYTDIHANLT